MGHAWSHTYLPAFLAFIFLLGTSTDLHPRIFGSQVSLSPAFTGGIIYDSILYIPDICMTNFRFRL